MAPESPVTDPSVPIGLGYTESKWISEQVLEASTKEAGLPTTSVRLGQVSGNPNGYWNEKEWFPSIVKSAVYVRCLPDMPGVSGLNSSFSHTDFLLTDLFAVGSSIVDPGARSGRSPR